MSLLFSLVGKLLALRVWQWVVVGAVLFAIYCVWCLWLASRAETELNKLDAAAASAALEAKADASKFSVWFRSILVRLHFAKPKAPSASK